MKENADWGKFFNSKIDEKVLVLLEEYKLLREETLQKFQLQVTLITFIAGAEVTVIGIVVANSKLDLLYLIPVFAVPLYFRYIWEQTVLHLMGKYVKEELVEKRFKEVLGERNNSDNKYESNWLGWEHYYAEWSGKIFRKIGIPKFYKYASICVFIILPFEPALIYSLINMLTFSGLINFDSHSYLSGWWHVLLFIGYLSISLILFSELVIVGQRIEDFKENDNKE